MCGLPYDRKWNKNYDPKRAAEETCSDKCNRARTRKAEKEARKYGA